jgi:hypothetical protein
MAAGLQAVTVALCAWIQGLHDRAGGKIEETELHLELVTDESSDETIPAFSGCATM